jgi:Predicted metal-binding integral membrane protein (DUF2182)
VVGVPRGLSGILDSFWGLGHPGPVGTAQPGLAFPHHGEHNPLVGSLLLMAAGVYQWTTLKQACLSHYQTPSDFC